ncbi:MAG: radical SAM protein [Nitrospirae bacterium]|nr:radical SAM protein [Nitrospirota bacterium]
MNVLLLNPNRFRTPPAPPIGLEVLAGHVAQDGHSVRVLDLCFSDDMYADIDRAAETFRPDLAGITIRNIDSVLYENNEFYLEEIGQLVMHFRNKYGIPVIVGGAALSADPAGILEYLGADHAIAGPAEGVITEVLSSLQKGQSVPRLIRGFYKPYSRSLRCTAGIDYPVYTREGGIPGFETHKGCSSSCVYCLEADAPVAFKNPEDIVREITWFTKKGYNHFHLCDPEFNEDLDHALSFCTALKQSGMNILWTLYMKPGNYNQKLFRLMRETGVYLITLTVDSFKKCPLYWDDIEKIIFNAKTNGIKISVDFLTGFPYEDEELLKWCLDFFRRLQPDRVNINTYIRLYKALTITRIISKDPSLASCLKGNTDDDALIHPVFFNRIDNDKLRQYIGDDPIFRIDGAEKGVNYTRS